MNSLYQQMNKNVNPFGSVGQLMQNLRQLKASGGDPNQRIQELLNSGRVSQADYNAAVQKANALRQILG